MANLFISHRKSDSVKAEILAEELKKDGHQIWFDEWELSLGDSIIRGMNEGLENADFLIVCYSSSGVTSEWMGREWMSALARQLNKNSVKILPVILSSSVPPAILADIKYIDLTKDWNQGISELIKVINK